MIDDLHAAELRREGYRRALADLWPWLWLRRQQATTREALVTLDEALTEVRRRLQEVE